MRVEYKGKHWPTGSTKNTKFQWKHKWEESYNGKTWKKMKGKTGMINIKANERKAES